MTIPSMKAADLSSRTRALLPSLVGFLFAVLAVVLLRTSGSLHGVVDALVFMGFDLDRAVLITALIAGAAAATLVAACGGHTAVAVLASIGATAAIFGATFARETRAAFAATGAAGTFDPLGWIVSVLTLIVAATIVGWAVATLATIVRRFVVAAARDARATVGTRPVAGARLVRPVAAIATLILLVATIPVFGDMVNFAPDTHMRAGSASVAVPTRGPGPDPSSGDAGSFSPGSASSAAPSPSVDPYAATVDPGKLPGKLVAGPIAHSLITANAVATARPWAATVPTGTGSLTGIDLPAPWIQGYRSVAHADVYMPPGYASNGTLYPVLYEVPHAINSWAKGVDIMGMMDNLITSGAIPPMIVVFASEYGGPFRDTECADSYDGRVHFDTYMANQLVPYIDAHFQTIATPAARAVFGYSQGGYCSAALWSHHPNVFGSSVSFSGYFVSGIASVETVNAALPFGRNAAYEAAQSPIGVVPRLSADVRDHAFVILSAKSDDSFFGSQLRAYAAVLDRAHVPMAILPARLGHSWQTQRDQLPIVLELLAGRMVKLGVFGPA